MRHTVTRVTRSSPRAPKQPQSTGSGRRTARATSDEVGEEEHQRQRGDDDERRAGREQQPGAEGDLDPRDEASHDRRVDGPSGTSSAVNARSTDAGSRSLATPLTSSTAAHVRTGRSRALGIPALSPSRAYSVAMTTIWEDLRDPPSRAARWRATLRKQPSAFLLAVQILVILLLPVLESSDWGRAVISLLSLSAVITAVFTVRSTPALTWLSVTLALPAAVFEVWSLVDDRSAIVVPGPLALAVFYFYTAYALISYMFEDYWVTKDELFAVGACFTVLVFAFAYVFLAIQEVWPGSFTSYRRPGAADLPRAHLPLGRQPHERRPVRRGARSCPRPAPWARSSSSPASCTSRWSSRASSR